MNTKGLLVRPAYNLIIYNRMVCDLYTLNNFFSAYSVSTRLDLALCLVLASALTNIPQGISTCVLTSLAVKQLTDEFR